MISKCDINLTNEDEDRGALVAKYESYPHQEERSTNTVLKYARDLRAFFSYLDKEPISKESLLCWKESLIQRYEPASVNSMLAAVNGFLQWRGMASFKVKPLKIQRAIFSNPHRELSRQEYNRLVETAEKTKDCRLALLLQTVCATGIRVSELKFITVEAVREGRAFVDCKGKNRIVFLPKKLCTALNQYCKHRSIQRGVVFVTKSGKPLDRSNIWKAMKSLCLRAGVETKKVFPHNLRHLFARVYYEMEKDLSKLADLLGHSSINTTRIYTMESGKEHAKQLEKMNLFYDR